jgi:acyl-CoA thioester hydrolase
MNGKIMIPVNKAFFKTGTQKNGFPEIACLHRVAYAETDAMKVVYYANYLVWYERGRSEYMRKAGLLYTKVEKEGFMLPVIEAGLKYKKSAVYDDLVTIYTSVQKIERSTIDFAYRIFNHNKELLNTGYTRHVMVNQLNRPVRIPEEYKKVLTGHGFLNFNVKGS